LAKIVPHGVCHRDVSSLISQHPMIRQGYLAGSTRTIAQSNIKLFNHAVLCSSVGYVPFSYHSSIGLLVLIEELPFLLSHASD
jgi:hypothetical protein